VDPKGATASILSSSAWNDLSGKVKWRTRTKAPVNLVDMQPAARRSPVQPGWFDACALLRSLRGF
jgi:hypothetical protein